MAIIRDNQVHYTFGEPWPIAAHYAAIAIFLPPLLYGAWWLAAARAFPSTYTPTK